MDFEWQQGELAEGLRLYRSARFFEAHEAWESVWLGLAEPEKTFLQAIIQVTAAFHHLQRNNPEGAGRLLLAALHRLDRYPDCFGGLSVRTLRREIQGRIDTLADKERSLRLSPVPIDPIELH